VNSSIFVILNEEDGSFLGSQVLFSDQKMFGVTRVESSHFFRDLRKFCFYFRQGHLVDFLFWGRSGGGFGLRVGLRFGLRFGIRFGFRFGLRFGFGFGFGSGFGLF